NRCPYTTLFRSIRFEEDEVRAMGRTAAGVRGIRLRDDDQVVAMEIVEEDNYILHITERGIGKRSIESQYRKTRRGGKGYFLCRLTEDTGEVVAVQVVEGNEDMMLMTVAGVLIRIPVDSNSITGRSTQGVRLNRLQEDEAVATVAKIAEEDVEEIDEDNEEEQDQSSSEDSEEEIE